MPHAPLSFDLVVATIGRDAELGRLLDSLEAQTYSSFRVLVVDQNEDGRALETLAGRPLRVVRLTSRPGLARARNVALEHVVADLVSFPDDDCVYPPTLLERLAERFARKPSLDGLSGRTADGAGRSDRGWGETAVPLTKTNVWNLVASAGIVLRRSLVERVGRFDERLGLGSGEQWSSGEETDFVIRALELGARIEYDPALVVEHDLAAGDPARLRSRGRQEGTSVGYLLGKHRYSKGTLARMLVRPVGGMALSLVRLDTAHARFHAATLRGRVRGYFGARRSKSSA